MQVSGSFREASYTSSLHWCFFKPLPDPIPLKIQFPIKTHDQITNGYHGYPVIIRMQQQFINPRRDGQTCDTTIYR